MADFLLALADFDRRRLWRELGHASLFSYLRRELALSAGAAQYRKTAAELIQRYPEVETALRQGRLCLSTVVEVARVLTPENQRDVLPRFFGLSRREAEAVAASIRPAEVVPRREVVTALVPVGRTAGAADRPEVGRESTLVRPAEVPATLPAPTPRPVPRDAAQPLDSTASRLHATVSRRFLEKLEAAKDALSHARPGASAEEVLEAGLDLLLSRHAKRKGLVAKPRKSAPSRADTIPAHVRRAAWIRAGGRCEWRFDSGAVCGSTTRLELDHVDPKALGGPPVIDNVRVLCRSHNDLAARRVFGDSWMDRFSGKRGLVERPPPSEHVSQALLRTACASRAGS